MNHNQETCRIKGCGVCDTTAQRILSNQPVTDSKGWEEKTLGEPDLNHLAEIIIDDQSGRAQRIRKIKHAIRTIEAAAYQKGLKEGAEMACKYIEAQIPTIDETGHFDSVRSILEAARNITSSSIEPIRTHNKQNDKGEKDEAGQ